MARKLQISIALDAELRERLEKLASEAACSIADEIRQRVERTLEQDEMVGVAASKSGYGIAEEIRQRVQHTLKNEELFDDSTRWLGQEICLLARDVQRQSKYGWRAHPKSHEALAEAVATILEQVKPPAVQGEDTWGSDDPKTLGRAVARARKSVMEMAQEMRGTLEGARAKLQETRAEVNRAAATFKAEQENIRAEVESSKEMAKNDLDDVVEKFTKVLSPKQRKAFLEGLKAKGGRGRKKS